MTNTVQLKYPFTFDGSEVTELTLRRPKMRDMKRVHAIKDDLEKSIRMISDLAEVSPKLVEELDAEDFAAVGAMLGEFMGASAAPTP